MKEEYYIDWINSLDIKNSVFVNKIEDLYQNDNNILLDIISIILNKNVEDFNNEEIYKNLNYLEKIFIIMNDYFKYSYEINDEINLKNNTILLIQFLKSKYPNIINEELFKTTNNSNNTNNKMEIKERPKSSKTIINKSNLNEKKYNIKKIINENIIQKSNYKLNKYINKPKIIEESKNNESNISYNNKTQIIKINKEKKMEEFIINYLYNKGIINADEKNNEYLWKRLIPELKDGYIIGKLINLLENKSNNYLKDISKETFYKVNINLNWKKIKEFLIKKDAFNSSYLFQKNFYKKNIYIFYLLYDICKYYYTRKELKDNKKLCKRSYSVKNTKNEKTIKKIKEKINMDNISTKEEIIKATKLGLYTVGFNGGSVDPATGEFNFGCSEAYIVRDGKVCEPVKGATLIGKGYEILMNIDMIGNDLELAQGMCGASSGSIRTQVGQPTLRLSKCFVGGRGGELK